MEVRLGGVVRLGGIPTKELVEGNDEGALVVGVEGVLVVGMTQLTGLGEVAEAFVAHFEVIAVPGAFEFAGLDEGLVPSPPAFLLSRCWLPADV